MSHAVFGVDFSTRSVRVLARSGSGEPAASESILPEEAVAEGRVEQPNVVRLYVAKLMNELNVRGRELRLCLADTAVVTKYVNFPLMPKRDLQRALRFEAVRELPFNPRNAYVGWSVVERTDVSQTILLAAAWRDVVDSYLEAVKGLGQVKVIEPRSMALARAVGLADSIVLELQDDYVQATIVENRRVTYTTSARLSQGLDESPSRLSSAVANLLPRTVRSQRAAPTTTILLGRLYGREDVAEALSLDMPGIVGSSNGWRPDDALAGLCDTGQTANAGILMRN